MPERLRKWWPVLKVVFGLVILFFIGRSLASDLAKPELWQRSFDPLWLLPSGALYVLGLGCTMTFWGVLLRGLNQQPTFVGLLRGYYIGLLGKYVPGKAWALLLRNSFLGNGRVNPVIAVQTGFYEVMMMMLGGTVLACVLFALTGPNNGATLDAEVLLQLVSLSIPESVHLSREVLTAFAAAMSLPFLLITFPPLFNRIASGAAKPLARFHDGPLPQIKGTSYLRGLPLEIACWLCMGASLCCTLNAVWPNEIGWTWYGYGYVTAATALACVAGFVIIVVPSGLGVREYLLIVFLRPYFPGSTAAVAVIVFRIVWTISEVILAGGLYLAGRMPWQKN
jgi:hypothetical protein